MNIIKKINSLPHQSNEDFSIGLDSLILPPVKVKNSLLVLVCAPKVASLHGGNLKVNHPYLKLRVELEGETVSVIEKYQNKDEVIDMQMSYKEYLARYLKYCQSEDFEDFNDLIAKWLPMEIQKLYM